MKVNYKIILINFNSPEILLELVYEKSTVPREASTAVRQVWLFQAQSNTSLDLSLFGESASKIQKTDTWHVHSWEWCGLCRLAAAASICALITWKRFHRPNINSYFQLINMIRVLLHKWWWWWHLHMSTHSHRHTWAHMHVDNRDWCQVSSYIVIHHIFEARLSLSLQQTHWVS